MATSNGWLLAPVADAFGPLRYGEVVPDHVGYVVERFLSDGLVPPGEVAHGGYLHREAAEALRDRLNSEPDRAPIPKMRRYI